MVNNIDISTKKDGERILVVLDITLKDGKKGAIGGSSSVDEREGHLERPRLSFKSLSIKDLKALGPDELSLNLGIVKATWRRRLPV